MNSFNPIFIPLVFVAFICLLLILSCWILQHLLAKQKAKILDVVVDKNCLSKLTLWQRMIYRHEEHLQKTVFWIKVVAVSILCLMSLTALLDYFSLLFFVSDNAQRFRLLPDTIKRINQEIYSFCNILYKVAVVLISAFWFSRIIEDFFRILIGKYIRKTHSIRSELREQTLNSVSTYIVNVCIVVIFLITILQSLNINIAPLLATAGVASVAIGFGAQALVRDVLAGFFILLEDQFVVGDVVTIDGKEGLVETMTLRTTRLRTLEGHVYIVPNGEIKTVQNQTSLWSRINCQVIVDLGTDVDKALKLIDQESQKIFEYYTHDVLNEPEILGIEKVEDKHIKLKFLIKTKPSRQWSIRRDLNMRLVKRFKEEKIDLIGIL